VFTTAKDVGAAANLPGTFQPEVRRAVSRRHYFRAAAAAVETTAVSAHGIWPQ
jgi:hypothetical protein